MINYVLTFSCLNYATLSQDFFSQMFIFFHYRHEKNQKNTNFQVVFRLFTYSMLACVYILAEEIKCDADKALHNRCPHSLTTDLQSAFGKKTKLAKNCQVKMCHLDRLQPKKTVVIKLSVCKLMQPSPIFFFLHFQFSSVCCQLLKMEKV